MRHSSSRKSAEADGKWKTFIKTLVTSTSFYLFVFDSVDVSWAGQACLSNPCIYGICIDEVNGTFLCYCIDGYTGFLCQTNWDECWSYPCLNGGTCIDGIAHYNCSCPQGYLGKNCEKNIDECDSNPCHNNGTCIDGPNGYTCVCPPGYLGSLCETDITVCNDTQETRCLNGGLCIEGPGYTFNCACSLGWEGEFCEEAINECASSPCRNGAVCLDLQGNYTCACPFGFSGRNCETELEMCGDTSPCQNGAVCLVEDRLRVCYCVPDFHGDRCQFQYNECLLGPGCQNGGTCIDGVDGYDCSCPLGWDGNFCECLIINEQEMDCSYPLYPQMTLPPAPERTVPIWIETNVPKTTPSTFRKIPTTSTTPNYFFSLLTECIPIWPQYTWRSQQTTRFILPKKTTSPYNWFTKKFFPTQGTQATHPTEMVTTLETKLTATPTNANTTVTTTTPATPTTTTTTQTTPTTTTTTTQTTSTTTTTTQTTPTTTTTQTTPTTTTTTQTTPTTTTIIQTTPTTTTTTQTTPTMTTTTQTTTTTTSTTTQTTPTTTTTQTKPTTTSTTTQTTPTTTTTQTKPTTTSTTTQTTPTTTTTTQTTPTTTTTTQTTPTTTTTTQTIPTTTSTTTQTTPTTTTTTQTTFTTTSTTQTTPTTTTTTTQTMPTTTTSTETTPTKITTTTTETTPTTTTQTTPTTEGIPIMTIQTKTTTTTQTTPITIMAATKTTGITSDTSTTQSASASQTLFSSTFVTSTTAPTQIFPRTPTAKTFLPFTPTDQTSILGATTHCVDFNQTVPTPLTPWNCKMIPCLNGGTCLNTTNGPRCICKSNWEGPFCDNKTDIKVAGFSGKSYLSHRLTNTHNIMINVTARTITPVGMILYSHLGPNIFMTLYLEDELLKFKFSCGVQTMILSEVQFHINNGFDLVASVTLDFFPPSKFPIHCAAVVRINNTLAMSGEQLAKGPHADSGSAWVYLGGVPSRYVDKVEAPVLKGFVGCMQNLVIDRKPKGIFKDSFDSNEVTECKFLACLSNPCRSGSTCMEYNNSWTCLCPSGFLGRNCQRSVCSNNPCKFGGTCAPFPGSGFICLCPLGKQGLFCENDVQTGYPLFASSIGGLSSFAAYKLPTEIYQDMLLTFKFLPHDMEQISLMIFIGQDGYHRATSDHLAVSFIKGYVVLTWNLGSGPRRIFTKYPVPSMGRFFHTVQIGRTGQRAWLAVDNQQNVTGKSPGRLTQLNTRSIVYLGGHDSKNFSLLPHDLPLHTGFSGCLFDVELRTGQMIIKIEKTPPAFSRGVGQCGRSLCNEHSCENGGGCVYHGATFTCLCSDGWFGPTCSMKYNPCDSTRHNCSEGSTCVLLKRGFSCDCPIGKTGKYCELNEELSDVKLKGIRSYIALAIEGLNQFQSCIDLEIRPLSHHGLILYSGRQEENTFWSLSLQDRVLELRVSPGVHRKKGDILVIRSGRLLNLGNWYRIRAGRYGRRLFLWVEGAVNTGILLPGENLPPIGTIVYIGGVPDLSTLPVGVSGKILTPFHGCVRKFTSQWKGIPLTKANILEGRNIEDCDGNVCGGDVCDNGGTCHVNAKNEPFCTCLKHYTGKRCEHRLSCKEIKCQNGGRCAQVKSFVPQCNCPNGWGGPFCESGVLVKAPQFVGNSYLLVDRSESNNMKRRDTQNTVDVNFIYLNFTTAEPNGLLLWSSRENDTEFIGIGIENGKIKIVWAWDGYNTTTVTEDKQIVDGAWHDLTISMKPPHVTISINRKTVYKSNTNHLSYPLATDGRIFLGGFPEGQSIFNKTLGYFVSGFEGCLQQLAWGAERVIFNFNNFTGENIRTCDPFGLK